MTWANRIVGTGVEPASSFMANPLNWRVHPKPQQAAMKGALDEIGWIQNVIVNRTTGNLLDGHLRITLALRQGDDTPVPVSYVELSEGEEALALLTLDPITAGAVADKQKLDELLQQATTGEAALQELIADLAKDAGLDYGQPPEAAPEPQIDRAAELQEKWQTATGQLWEIGTHRPVCGDCTDKTVVDRVMQGERARLVWTDPPYGVKYGDKLEAANPMGYRIRTIQNDDLPPDELEAFIRSALKNVADVCIDGAAIYVASPAGTPLPTLIASFVGSGFDYHWGLIWLKDQLVLGRGDYHFKHENILYGWKPGAAHCFVEDRTQTSVFEYPRPKRSEEHPTMKPVELVEHMLRNSSEIGDIVAEPFAGSGTTLIACERLGRKCRAIEISPAYVAVSLQRLADMGLEPRLVE